jgi:membrane protein YqaA with SNARE-associated domain
VTALRPAPLARGFDWLLSARGLAVGFVWGVLEGTFFFLVPDILITLVALFSIRQSWRQLLAVLAGSLLAGGGMFYFASVAPELARRMVLDVPFVSQAMFETTRNAWEHFGVWALCQGPLSGIPYKVYAVQAPAHSGIVPFLLVSIPARLERFLVIWALFAALGLAVKRRIAANPGCAVAAHAVYWMSVYAVYWARLT